MDFRKIKFDGSKVMLTWLTEKGTDSVEHTLTSYDLPAPEFVEALRELAPSVCKVLELPCDYAASPDTFSVRGVSISYDEGDSYGRGVVVTSLRTLAACAAPLVLNTPFLAEEGENPADVPPNFWRLIEDACREAERYVNGHRAQGDLFPQEEAVRITKEDAAAIRAAAEAGAVPEPAPCPHENRQVDEGQPETCTDCGEVLGPPLEEERGPGEWACESCGVVAVTSYPTRPCGSCGGAFVWVPDTPARKLALV